MPSSELIWQPDRQSRAVEKAHKRTLRAIDAEAVEGQARVTAVADVTDWAIFRAMTTTTVRNRAEHMAPDGAEVYAALAFKGAMAMGEVIDGVARRTR